MEKNLRVVEKVRGSGGHLGIVEQGGIAATDFPRVEGRGPVDVIDDFAQRQVVDDLDPMKAGVGMSTFFQSVMKMRRRLSSRERSACRALAFVGDAGRSLFEEDYFDEFVALMVAEQGADDADGAGGVEDVTVALGVMLRDLTAVWPCWWWRRRSGAEAEALAFHFLLLHGHLVQRRVVMKSAQSR